MIRRLFYDVLLFLLPFALYGAYWRLAGRERAEAQAHPGGPSHPWTILFIAGLSLVAASFVVWGLTEGEPANGVYVPAHLKDGKVIPGQVKPNQADTGTR